MSMPKLVCWKSAEDIQVLKTWFFPENPTIDDIDLKQRALSYVRALQTRGRIPHSIESTALINSAILQDIKGTCDSYTVRLGYSMALVRFVNGIIDPYQKGQFVIPMYKLARNLDMPEAFVELRHEATHEGLPTLKLLQEMADKALDWLWTHYWAINKITADEEDLYTADGVKKLPANEEDYNYVKELFREYRRLRRLDSVKEITRGDTSELGVKLWAVVKSLQKRIEMDSQVVINVMLQMNVLIPKAKPKTSSGGGGAAATANQANAAKLFAPLFIALNDSDFIKKLALYGLDILLYFASVDDDIKLSQPAEDQDEPFDGFDKSFCSIWTEWIKFFMDPRPKKSTRSPLLGPEAAREIVDICKEFPNEWTLAILQYYTEIYPESTGDDLKLIISDMDYQLRLRTSENGKLPVKRDFHHLVEDVVSEVAGFEKRIKALQPNGAQTTAIAKEEEIKAAAVSEESPWVLVESWYPRPLGVA